MTKTLLLIKTKKIIIVGLFFIGIFVSYSQQAFSTFSFTASIENSNVPNAEVESTMDSEGNIHIAWIRDFNDVRRIMYTFYNTTTNSLSTYEVDNNFDADSKILGSINTLNNKPYISFLIRRDNSAGSRNGNYAVMLASDPDGNNGFNVEQVSTNPTDPTIEQEDLYSCYVNGRSNVFFSGNNVVVGYLSDAHSATNWDNHMIYATKSGSNWSYSQEFNVDEDLSGHYSIWDGTAVINDAIYSYAAYIEISEHKVQYIYKSATSDWTVVEVGDYGASFGNDHTQLVKDNDGDVHLFWYNDTNQIFCHTLLNGGSYSTVEETASVKPAGGNFMPSTIDKTLKTPIYHYQEGFNDEHFIFVNADGSSTEYTIPDEELGVPYGRKSIFADNGVMYLVTASQSDGKIYITSNDSKIVNSVLSTDNFTVEQDKVSIYPNPIVSNFKVNTSGNLNLYNATGRKVGYWQVKSNEEVYCESLSPGIYFYTLTDENNIQSKGKFIKKHL